MPECDYIWPLEMIDSVRRLCIDHYESDDKSLYDPTDIDEMIVDNWWIKRFIIHTGGNEAEALQMLIKCLKWRKEIGLQSISDNHFPEEIYRIGGLFNYVKDKNGIPTVYIRLKLVKRLKEVSDLIKLFIIYNFYKIDKESHGQGWGLIIDFHGAGLQNCDLDLAKTIVFSLKTYFPASIEYVICADFPWIFKAFWSFIKGWIPADRKFTICFTPRSQLNETIGSDFLPQALGGNCLKSTTEVPPGCPKFVDYCVKNLGLTEKVAEKVFSQYKPLLA
ncbi:motile sperm domain-containing protein 2-like [Tetranychus urticae]|uniref:CRAL-TRIO domain-containing protein n=1 Tax=Tetranychus urticae TaxID=32264 RepID=T1KQV8_TETUR|nr:motile sperm domain-containing protein 2-like [Tetranychus urticae]